jgi:hypothetical protein
MPYSFTYGGKNFERNFPRYISYYEIFWPFPSLIFRGTILRLARRFTVYQTRFEVYLGLAQRNVGPFRGFS